VANDSGPVHIAASMRTPVIGLYGPTSAQQFGPYPLTCPSNVYLQAPDGNLKALQVNSVMNKILKIDLK
jgi:ADP-heptose:LPS heptosyltransferase